jgi:hypothetical protein
MEIMDQEGLVLFLFDAAAVVVLALSILPSEFLRGARSSERGRSANRVLACWLHQPLFA